MNVMNHAQKSDESSLDASNGVNGGMVTTVFPPLCVELVSAVNNFWF